MTNLVVRGKCTYFLLSLMFNHRSGSQTIRKLITEDFYVYYTYYIKHFELQWHIIAVFILEECKNVCKKLHLYLYIILNRLQIFIMHLREIESCENAHVICKNI